MTSDTYYETLHLRHVPARAVASIHHTPLNREANAYSGVIFYSLRIGANEGIQMAIKRRVYVSMPGDQWLTPRQNSMKWAVVEQIERLGYTPEIFFNPRAKRGLASGKAFTASEAEAVARRCCGAAIIGLPRWTFCVKEGEVKIASEFCHYEGALARSFGLPTLILRQADILQRVVFDNRFGSYIGDFPADAGPEWLRTRQFRTALQHWKNQLNERRDIFLGYCSTSTRTAQKIKSFLKTEMGVKVLDWRTDFSPGLTILEQIQDAALRCSAGVFLFTQDDKLTGDSSTTAKAVPRDNVVFEAGYFTSMKDRHNVLIVLESGAKMPADLGGKVYADLKDRSSIRSIQQALRKFVSAL
jgi:hypothetical protein